MSVSNGRRIRTSERDVNEVTLAQLLAEKRKLVQIEKQNISGENLWICMLLLEDEIKRRKKAGEQIVDLSDTKKKKKKKKKKLVKRLREAFSFHTKSFYISKPNSKYQIASAAEDEKVASREFTEEDCQVVEVDEFLASTPKAAGADKPGRIAAEKSTTSSSTSTSSPNKYPAIAASEQRYQLKQDELAKSRSEMKLCDEFLKLFWRLNKSLNVLVYANNEGAICLQVYNKYTGTTYNKLFFTIKAILDAVANLDASPIKHSKRNSGTRSDLGAGILLSSSASASSTNADTPVSSSEIEKRHRELLKAAGQPVLLSEAVQEYLRSDKLGLVPVEKVAEKAVEQAGSDAAGAAGAAGAAHAADAYTLQLQGVDTVSTPEELGVAVTGKMQASGVVLTRTMTECKRIAETLSKGLGDSFQNLSEGNSQAEEMVSKTTEMLTQLEAVSKLIAIDEEAA